MRNAALTFVFFVALGYAAKSQKFSLLPQVGFENSTTKVSYNDLASFAPIGVRFSPQASLRLNYASKKGHGFFVGASTSQSMVSFSFTDPENGMNNFAATASDMRVRMEGGYQFTTRKISLGSSGKTPTSSNTEKKVCGYGCHSCCHNSNKARQNSTPQPRNSWVRIQPSVGMGFMPALKNDVVTKTEATQTTYQYNAGNWNTAVIAGTSFEFGRGNTRQFTVSINYIKGIGNLDQQTITSFAGGKQTTTTLESTSSAWNMRIGIPFTLGGKKSQAKPKTEKKPETYRGCGQYRTMYRCNRIN